MKLFSDIRKTTRDIYEEMFEKEVEQQEGLDFSLPEDGYLYEQPEFIAGIMHHMHCFRFLFFPNTSTPPATIASRRSRVSRGHGFDSHCIEGSG